MRHLGLYFSGIAIALVWVLAWHAADLLGAPASWHRVYWIPATATAVAGLAALVPWWLQRRARAASPTTAGRAAELLDGAARVRALRPVEGGLQAVAMLVLLMAAWLLGQIPRVARDEPMVEWPLRVGSLAIGATCIFTMLARSRAMSRELAALRMRTEHAASARATTEGPA